MLGRITSCLFLFRFLDIFFSTTTTIVNNNYNNNHTVKMMMNDDEDRYYSNSSDDDDDSNNRRPFYHYCTYPYCRRRYTNLVALVQHEMSAHTSRTRPYACSYCGQRFSRDVNRDLHQTRSCTVRRRNDQAAGSGIGGAAAAAAAAPVQPPPSIEQQRRAFNVRRTNSAFFGATNTYRILFNPQNSPVQFVELLNAGTETMYNKLHGFLVNRGSQGMKFCFAVAADFVQATDSSIITDPPPVLPTQMFECFASDDLREMLAEASRQMQSEIGAYERTGSGWCLHRLISLDVTVWEYAPL